MRKSVLPGQLAELLFETLEAEIEIQGPGIFLKQCAHLINLRPGFDVNELYHLPFSKHEKHSANDQPKSNDVIPSDLLAQVGHGKD